MCAHYDCFSDDWRRTNPDLVVYLPKDPPDAEEAVDHVLVDYTPGGDLLAIWTNVTRADGSDYQVISVRSKDEGLSWSDPLSIATYGPKPGQVSCFGFPITSDNGRIYCFYNRTPGVVASYVNAFLHVKYSDDDGYTWIDGGIEIPYRRTKFDHPDPSVGAGCIVWQKPIRDRHGRFIVGLTRWTADYNRARSKENSVLDCRCEFLRFGNIHEGPDPKDIQLTWLPDDEDLISVPVVDEPERSQGYVFSEEPAVVLLPDGRLFAVMRTRNGQIWYTVSDDDGHSWRPTEILRNLDDGHAMLHPRSPAPLYRLEDGRYLLFYHNHDGYGFGGHGPTAGKSRRPQFMAVGEYREDAHQPIWFSKPLLLFDTHSVGAFPRYRIWLSMYASLTERNGRRILWYADRKLFGLGRYISDEMLAPLEVPR